MPTKRYVRDKTTGKEFWADEFGDPIEEIKSGAPDSVLRTAPGIQPTIRAPTSADQFYNYIGRHVQPTLVGAGSTIGGILGSSTGPVGTAIGSSYGAGAGSIVGRLLQTLAPDYLGEYKPSGPVEVAGDVAKDVLVDKIFTKGGEKLEGLFPSTWREIFQKKLKNYFPPTDLSPTQLDALRADPKFKFTIGQTNPKARFAEELLTPAEKMKFVRGQESEIAAQFSKLQHPPEVLGDVAGTLTGQNISGLQTSRRQAYEALEPFKTKATRTVQVPTGETKNQLVMGGPNGAELVKVPILKDLDVKGAIPVVQSKQFADNLMNQVNEILGPNDINVANLGQGSGSGLRQLRGELEKITSIKTHIDPTTGKPMADPISSYDQLKQIRDGLQDFLSNTDIADPLKGRLKASLTALRATIKNDINEGVKLWGPRAAKTLEKADKIHMELAEKANPELTRKLLNEGYDPEITYTKILQDALSDPKKTRQFIAATGDREITKQTFLSDMVDKSWDAVNDRFDYNQAIKYLNDNKEIAKTAVPSQTLSNIERNLRKSQIAEPFQERANVGLKMASARGMIGLGVGASSLLTGHGLPPSVVGSGLVLGIGPVVARQFVKRVMYDPKLARIAAGLQSVDARTPFAKQGAKMLLPLLRGAQVYLMSPDGRKFPAQITADNKIKVLSNESVADQLTADQSTPDQLTADPSIAENNVNVDEQ